MKSPLSPVPKYPFEPMVKATAVFLPPPGQVAFAVHVPCDIHKDAHWIKNKKKKREAGLFLIPIKIKNKTISLHDLFKNT
jgi:hypothetical protein